MTSRRACDGPSCCSVTEFRDSIPLKGLWRSVVPTTVRPAIPLRSSESRCPYPNFRILSVLEWDPLDGPSCPWRCVVGSVDSASFSRNKICCSKRLNRSLQDQYLTYLMCRIHKCTCKIWHDENLQVFKKGISINLYNETWIPSTNLLFHQYILLSSNLPGILTHLRISHFNKSKW